LPVDLRAAPPEPPLSWAVSRLRAESDENTCRKDFTPTEAESLASSREALLKPLAKERQAHGQTAPGRNASPKLGEALAPRTDRAAATGTGFSAETIRKVRETKALAADPAKARQGTRTDLQPSSKLDECPDKPKPKPKPHKQETRHRTAKATGRGATTLDKAEEIVDRAADPATPEPVRQVVADALAEMDETGKVDAAYKKVKGGADRRRLHRQVPPSSRPPRRDFPEDCTRGPNSTVAFTHARRGWPRPAGRPAPPLTSRAGALS